MERLYSVKDICERYQVKSVTARKLMRNMVHMEAPLMVSERALSDFERSKTLPPENQTRELLRKGARR